MFMDEALFQWSLCGWFFQEENMKQVYKSYRLLFVLIGLLLVCGCTSNNAAYKYKIGVSQCMGGPWRDKVNNEMLSAQHLFMSLLANQRQFEISHTAMRISERISHLIQKSQRLFHVEKFLYFESNLTM